MSNKEKVSREEYLYHNTEVLLRKYRDVVISVEISSMDAMDRFEDEMECKLDEFLEMSYAAGMDFEGTKIQGQARTLERNKKMLYIIDKSVELLRTRYKKGEIYYWVLYYSFLSEYHYKDNDEIKRKVEEKIGYISEKTFYTYKKDSIRMLSNILWGFLSKDTLNIVNLLMP